MNEWLALAPLPGPVAETALTATGLVLAGAGVAAVIAGLVLRQALRERRAVLDQIRVALAPRPSGASALSASAWR